MSELYQSLSHSKCNCKYHVVFVPKYRRKLTKAVDSKFLVQPPAKPPTFEEITSSKAGGLMDVSDLKLVYGAATESEAVDTLLGINSPINGSLK